MTDAPAKNLYDLLEVSPRARPEVITAAYKSLMNIYHPDKPTGDARVAKSLNQAKDILLNKDKRQEYDVQRENLVGTTLGEYTLLGLIAEGGFGKTYKAKHTLLNELVCIKHAHYVSPQDEEILLNEAKAIWDLRHFSIPAVRNILKMDDGSLALVMSYVPGPTLEQIIKKVDRLEPEHVAWITERSLNALKYLHYNGVVHGDVKPQNIIIQPENHTIVLVDYGLSVIRPSPTKSTSPGFTPYFAAPEQIHGKTLLPETDFYGLGMTMIYALGGDIEKKLVPKNVPDSLCSFIKSLIVYDVLKRPNWEKEDLADTLKDIRMKEFGRLRSGMKPIPGL
ncbi:MAG: protein kinase [archaeon]